jgi:lipopolysaccharide transport system permease protein
MPAAVGGPRPWVRWAVVATELDQATGDVALGATEPPATRGPARLTVIRPPAKWPQVDLRELWHYHELLGIFVWRDLKVRYKQTVVGAGWAIFQPILIAAVYSVVYGRFAKFPSGGIPYPIFVFAGLLPWQYFSSALNSGAISLVANTNLVTKVYFPRLLLPIATIAVPIVDLLLSCVVMIGLMGIYGTWPNGPEVLLAPAFVVLAAATALGLGLWLSAVNVRYRDVPYALPVFMQVLPLLSGVPFALSGIPTKWQWILSLNPMSTVVAGWRWAVLGAGEPQWSQCAVGVAMAVLLLVGGLWYFRSSEPSFADTI